MRIPFSPCTVSQPATSSTFDRATVVGKGTSKYKREFVEAWNTTSTCVNQSMNLDPGYKALREYWRRQTRPRLPLVPWYPSPHASTAITTPRPPAAPRGMLRVQCWLEGLGTREPVVVVDAFASSSIRAGPCSLGQGSCSG